MLDRDACHNELYSQKGLKDGASTLERGEMQPEALISE